MLKGDIITLLPQPGSQVKARKPRRQRQAGRTESTAPAFVELLAQTTGATFDRGETSCLVEVESRQGAKMRLELKGMQASELAELIRALPEGVTEFMCHPGRCGDDLRSARTRLKESREEELRALTAREVRVALAETGVKLASFRDLQ